MFRGSAFAVWLLVVLALASPTSAEAVQNGNFEQGAPGWVQSSSGGFPLIVNEPAFAHGGSWDAWLGGYDSGTDILHQDFVVPANAATATLRFWYRVSTVEVTPS